MTMDPARTFHLAPAYARGARVSQVSVFETCGFWALGRVPSLRCLRSAGFRMRLGQIHREYAIG